MPEMSWERRQNGILVGTAQIGQRHFECVVVAEEKRARWTFAGLPWNHFLEEFSDFDRRGNITFTGKMEDRLKARCQGDAGSGEAAQKADRRDEDGGLKMINWSVVKRHRAGEYSHLSEEELIGTGRSTTMLLDALDYLKRMDGTYEPGTGIVVIVPASALTPHFKKQIAELASEVDMYVTKEQKDRIWINNRYVNFCSPLSKSWYGHAEVFVDHGVLSVHPKFMETSGLSTRYANTLRGQLERKKARKD